MNVTTSYEPPSGNILDRSNFSATDIITEIWTHVGLPKEALTAVNLSGEGHVLPSSFRIADLAQASIALSALSAAQGDSIHNATPPKSISVDRVHAAVEFASERLYSIDGKPAESAWGPIGGLHRTRDGYVRMHDAFSNHRRAATDLLGLSPDATKADVAEKIKDWAAVDLEKAAMQNGAVIYALRSYEEWDILPQAQAIPDSPITIRKIGEAERTEFPRHMPTNADRCLRGLRVVEMSRVIAAPVAGRTLAAHGAEVLWITSPNLPNLPPIDKDVSRGKKTVHLDLSSTTDSDAWKLRDLIRDADVFIQSYRPGSLAARGFGPEALAELHPGIVVANLSAWGDEGPWREMRGFDSMVQTVSGLNRSEWEHCNSDGPPAKALPVQALDHAAGYFLATAISAALYRRAVEGGSWEVNVSLAGVMKYLRSLGQVPVHQVFDGDVMTPEEHMEQAINEGREVEILEEKMSGFGMMKAVRHSARVEGKIPGFDVMPKGLGSDEAEWA